MKVRTAKSILNSSDYLVAFAASKLAGKGESFTFEPLVAECFNSFPNKFCLKGYPQWPDSAKINKCWLRCRSDRGWMTGRPDRGLALTSTGWIAAAAVAAELGVYVADNSSADSAHVECRHIVEMVKQSSGFLTHGPRAVSISAEQAREAIGVQLETPRRLTRSNLRQAQACAKQEGDADALIFLKYCEGVLDLKRPWKAAK